MIHSSQQPVEKLPLTRGRTVDTMVRKLTCESAPPPPPPGGRTPVAPSGAVQHNGNRPFSYTRATSPIIYAQVVSNGDARKQTVHAAFAPSGGRRPKQLLPHSDSDEGLGYEPSKSGDPFFFEPEECPITPQFQASAFAGFDAAVFGDSSCRGRADGMDGGGGGVGGGRKDLSARRDQLESRLARRFEERAIYNYDAHRRFQDAAPAAGERKDKLGDSGIETDFFGGGGRRKGEESEDEGFASSLLIASERQHAEDDAAARRRHRRGYDSDRGRYVARERSIDDGSHFDPRIDKPATTDRKPPKPEKRSGLEKVKQLFTGGRKKKEKQAMVREESLRARYTEYRGDYAPRSFPKDSAANSGDEYQRPGRRLSSTSPSPPRDARKSGPQPTHGSWFKSLDRLSRKKSKKSEKDDAPKPTKSLRFFGDTDQESTSAESGGAAAHKAALKASRRRSQSTRDLHNITEEAQRAPATHRSMLNLHQVDAGVASPAPASKARVSLKPPASPSHRGRPDATRSRQRRKNEVSSVESSTEGDSSQQSQRSIVYLHAATVGDIPGPGCLRSAQKKTLSRSFSVLAPWKPRHGRANSMDIEYAQQPPAGGRRGGKYEQFRSGSSRRESSTLKKRTETRRSGQQANGGGSGATSSSTLGSSRRSRSKENVPTPTLAASLYKKRERQPPKESSRYARYEDHRRMAAKCASVECLGADVAGGRHKAEVSRSISMPRDPEKSAGWFSMPKSRSKSKSMSAHRL